MISVSKPHLQGNELKYVTDCVKSGWISSAGDYVKQFEQKWAEYNDYKYGVACSSGTNALILALRALNIGKGDLVIVPEYTMVATAWAVTYVGAKCIFIDCDETQNIDVKKLNRIIVPENTKAIIPVNVYGRSVNQEAIKKFAYEHNLWIIEDAAESHGLKPFGDIVCYSLYGNKIITSGEGGICLTNVKRLAEQMEHLRGMAFNPEHTFLHKKMAYNFRMTNLQAAVALAQAEQIDEILKRRKQIESWYDGGLKGMWQVKLMPKRDVVWFYDVKVHHRDRLAKYLKENGVETRVGFKPMSMQPMYFNPDFDQLEAYRHSLDILYLPTYPDLKKSEVDKIIKLIKQFYVSRPN